VRIFADQVHLGNGHTAPTAFSQSVGIPSFAFYDKPFTPTRHSPRFVPLGKTISSCNIYGSHGGYHVITKKITQAQQDLMGK
jgi:hypothetical protein